MKSGYDKFFKDARKTAETGTSVKFQKSHATSATGPRLKLDLNSDQMVEAQMRRRAGIKPKKKKPAFPWKLTGASLVGLLVALWGFQNYEKVEYAVKHVEIDLLGVAQAEEAPPAKKSPEKEMPKAPATKVASADKDASGETAADETKKDSSGEDLDHLTKLNDRKKELDSREEELNRMEQELQVQKGELEKRMKELSEMRTQISSVLEDRVKVDDTKIDTLVQMYSNMKAPQAAKVFETMDEDLAVEIVGRMKKKNAADIMNLLKPEKAQIFSEKYAGYKREPAQKARQPAATTAP
jgi:flagellar motility protein MotE (MotC chaperone)